MNWMKITPPDGYGRAFDTRVTEIEYGIPWIFVTQIDNTDALSFAQADVENISIPGRSGDLLMSRDRFNNVERVFRWYIPRFTGSSYDFGNVRTEMGAVLSVFSQHYCKIESNLFPNRAIYGRLSGASVSATSAFLKNATIELTFDCMPQIWDISGLDYTDDEQIDDRPAGSYVWPNLPSIAFNFYGTMATPAWRLVPEPDASDSTMTKAVTVYFRYGVDSEAYIRPLTDSEPYIMLEIAAYPVAWGGLVIDTQARQIFFDGNLSADVSGYMSITGHSTPNFWPVLQPNGATTTVDGTVYETNWIRITRSTSAVACDYAIKKRGWTL